MKGDFVFSSESVTAGHPDKLCDQISDGIVDRFLAQDPFARISAETAIANGMVFLACRFDSSAKVDVAGVAREVIHHAGYDGKGRFNARDCSILTNMQSATPRKHYLIDELQTDSNGLDAIFATHQCNSFGFACRETEDLLPLPIWLAHKVARRLHEARNELDYLAADGQVQIGVEYRAGIPERIHSISVLASHYGDTVSDKTKFRDFIYSEVIERTFKSCGYDLDSQVQFLLNPYGDVVEGGPHKHAGLTGRKTHVDTFGEFTRHSGAALSGKDPLRIDRVGAYAARHAAKNIVAAGLAEECEVQLSYQIGQPGPVSVSIDTRDTGKVRAALLHELVMSTFDFRLGAIVREMKLRHLADICGDFCYSKLAVYGHMGRSDMDVPWERTDRVENLLGQLEKQR